MSIAAEAEHWSLSGFSTPQRQCWHASIRRVLKFVIVRQLE